MDKLPTKEQILDWIRENPTLSAKRDLARAFGIKGSAVRTMRAFSRARNRQEATDETLSRSKNM